MSTRLSQEQRLQQRLTPLQVRYVRMLEMSVPEFEQEIKNALDEMPALESSEVTDSAEQLLGRTEDGGDFNESGNDMQIADYRSEDDIPDYLRRDMYRNSQALPADYYEPTVAATGETAIESLTRQLSELDLSEDRKLIARYIIGNLDNNGYMTRSAEAIADDIAFAEGQDYPVALIRQVAETVRSLDPPGIGAFDLRDCLMLQLKRLPRTVENLTALEIVKNYFDLFSKRHFDRIASAAGISQESLRDALEVISKLNPKPAGIIDSASTPAETIIPDFQVEADHDGTLTLTLPNRIPELRIEESFADDPRPSTAAGLSRSDRDARTFIRQKREEAADFIHIVGMRQQTLFTVMSAILHFQRPFFLSEDESKIKPMVLRELADYTGLDISVISRATQGKYVATRHGVYPLKMFFNERIHKDDSDTETDNTYAAISAEIKEIIASEDKKHPLSDLQITARLAEKGYDIARRTVAKYRERLGLPVGRLRKDSLS